MGRSRNLVVVGAVFGLVFSGSAVAGERSTAPSWQGFYTGVGLGVRSTDVVSTSTGGFSGGLTSTPDPTTASARFDSSTVSISGYFGYNWRFAPTWVLGVEGDLGWADKTTSVFGLPGFYGTNVGVSPLSGDNVDFRATWDASVRVRLGYLLTPSVMIYGTGGPSWLHVEETVHCGGACTLLGVAQAVDTASTTRLGWTVGGGIETMISGNWLARAEYRYADFGTWSASWHANPPTTGGNAETKLRTQTALFGLAYKFGSNNPAQEAYASAAPAMSWGGYYAGLAVGSRAIDSNWTTTSLMNGGVNIMDQESTTARFNNTAARVGGIFGYNWLFAPKWLAGIEADLGWAGQERSFFGLPGGFGPTFGPPLVGDSVSLRTSWDASLRARLGVLVTPTFLTFVTAGPAWLRAERTFTCNGVCPQITVPTTFSETANRLGWTIGAGFETAVGGNWLARADYRYGDFGKWNADWILVPNAVSGTADIKIATHTAQVGLVYKFGR